MYGMKLLYPGSFNPFHEGHGDIFEKASKLGNVTIAMHQGTAKKTSAIFKILDYKVDVVYFDGLLADLVKEIEPDTIVRGLRNGNDLQYEMNMQYWNEDLGIEIPFIYFVCDRELSHISSSAIREIKCLTIKKSGQ